MPCNAVRTIRMDLQAADLDLVADTLADLGYEDVVNVNGRVSAAKRGVGLVVIGKGQISLPASADQGDHVNAIRRAYAGRTLAKASRRFGWTMRQQPTQGSGTRYAISRR